MCASGRSTSAAPDSRARRVLYAGDARSVSVLYGFGVDRPGPSQKRSGRLISMAACVKQNTELVSAIICPRGRPESLLRTVRSLLDDDESSFELIVMDQSEGFESENALQEFSADRRLRYQRSRATGKGAAL